jgi:hypothetical protein
MKALMAVALATGVALLLTGCGSGQGSSSLAQPAAAPSVAAPLAAAASATPAVAAQAATPAANPDERVTGTVQSIVAGKVSLKEGSSFSLGPNTPITRQAPGTVADLQPGRTVAVTAKRQPDNTLLASLVRIQPLTRLGQSPLDGGDLMTNATVDKVTGNSFTVTFPGGGAQVTLAPNGQIFSRVDGSQADIKEGASVSATVRDGVAQSVSIQ